ncbi:MAG: sulfite exporter TauE/SafE family protein, partial [Flavobacteriaceae bacterium]|nr:sulfite exporter TauE/SafE family protein [Flavobacteriaceae bacterium]
MLYLAFILGIMGSLHCVGMCGAIVLVLPIKQQTHFITKYIQLFLYFLGKIIAYVTLGIAFGILGKGLFISHYQQEFSIFIGVVMLVMGLMSVFHLHFHFLQKSFFFEFQQLKSILGKLFQKRNFFTPFFIGFFNGFLPCGLVYTALFSALTNIQLADIVLYMVFFGLGTIPLMLLL